MQIDYNNLSILVAISGLLGYLIKQIVPKLMANIKEKDDYIKGLVSDFTKATTEFTDVQNHKTTEMTEALRELTEVNKQVVATLKRRK